MGLVGLSSWNVALTLYSLLSSNSGSFVFLSELPKVWIGAYLRVSAKTSTYDDLKPQKWLLIAFSNFIKTFPISICLALEFLNYAETFDAGTFLAKVSGL